MFKAAPNVVDQPVIVTKNWRIYAIDEDFYLVCHIAETDKMRTTTAIVESDPEKQEFTTASGRVYKCIGPMSENTLIMRMYLFLNGYNIGDVNTFDDKKYMH